MYSHPSVIYRINSRDEIVFVNDKWNQFASANNSVNLMKHEVIRKPIWSFITDYSTRELYQQMVETVRKGKTIQFKYRCDSPDRRRFMEMAITFHKDNNVQFESKTIFTEERHFQKLLDVGANRSDNFLVMCSFCKKVNIKEDDWLNVEDAMQAMRIFESDEVALLSHGICKECYDPLIKQYTLKNNFTTL